jgi:hypothetical protein
MPSGLTRWLETGFPKKLCSNKELEHDGDSTQSHHALERFPAKWIPVRVKKTRQNKRLELRSDSIGTEKALERDGSGLNRHHASLLD